MNILVEELPEAVQIGESVYPIVTDFRAALRVYLAFEDDDLAAREKIMILLANLYPETPDDIEGAIMQGLKFLNCGEEAKNETDAPRLYSFTKDASLIFAAFHQTHGIDLETAEMHWWKFWALFMDLGADTAFCNLVSLRKRVNEGTATKEERRAVQKMGAAFDVPQHHSPEEKAAAAEFWRADAERQRREREGQ